MTNVKEGVLKVPFILLLACLLPEVTQCHLKSIPRIDVSAIFGRKAQLFQGLLRTPSGHYLQQKKARILRVSILGSKLRKS